LRLWLSKTENLDPKRDLGKIFKVEWRWWWDASEDNLSIIRLIQLLRIKQFI
jgi:hypothetical protein